MHDFIVITLLLTGTLNFFTAILVLSRSPKKAVNISFAVMALCTAAWIYFIAGFYVTKTFAATAWFIKLYMLAPALLVASGIIFADIFPHDQFKKVSKLKIGVMWTMLIASVSPIFFVHHYIIRGIISHSWGKQVINNRAAYVFYGIYIALGFLLMFLSIRKSAKKQKGVYLTQVNLFFTGIGIAAAFGLVFNLVLPIAGNYEYIWIGPTMSTVFVFFTAYGIVRHRLFDIRLVIARSVAYILSFGLLLGGYAVISYATITLIASKLQGDLKKGVNLAIILGVAVCYQPIRHYFNKVSNRLFYRDAYDPQELFDNLNRILVANVDLGKLMKQSTALIAENLKASYCAIGLKGDTPTANRIVGTSQLSFKLEDILLVRQATPYIHSRVIAADYLEGPEQTKLKTVLDRNDIAVLIRLAPNVTRVEEGIGYLVLGQKKSGNSYNTQDFRILDIVANELIIAIQNALRFEEIEGFNVTLQSKVDDATRKLRKTNEKLKELDETKDDFISMASHQLRTPLTSVKGYISMVLDEDVGKINHMQREMLGQAFFSSQRMVYLIADLLNVSRLKSGKFVIEPVKVNLSTMVQQEMEQLEETAAARSLTLKYEKPVNFPDLMLDETKTRQVIMNFIDNAIYYTKAGGHITVRLLETPQTIELRIEDDGIGVPKSEQPHLFTKFYRAGNARKARPDGTGLGLFMAKKVIIAQGGSTIFSSQEGKGSTFGFVFSKARLAPSSKPDAHVKAPEPALK